MSAAPSDPPGFWRVCGKSFIYAWRGVVFLVTSQGNARIHLAATVAVVALGLVFRVSPGEWAALSLAVGMVFVAEGLNTAIEQLSDRITLDPDERIRRAKDLGAGAVLLAAIAAAIVGLCIFGPRLWALFM
jgi:diacylglycerol kinase (ATP)